MDRCLSTEIDAFIGSTFIELDDVHVPVDHLIGQENKGFPLTMSSEYWPSISPWSKEIQY